jgi:drug/metabolite transporter (DMT)-like permease
LAKAFGDRLRNGGWSTVASWEPYAVVVGGIITMLLVQSAYQVGRATATLPMLTVAEPIVASSIGVALFGEHVHLAGWRGPVVVVSLAVVIRSLMLIATSSGNPAMAASVGEGGLH